MIVHFKIINTNKVNKMKLFEIIIATILAFVALAYIVYEAHDTFKNKS